ALCRLDEREPQCARLEGRFRDQYQPEASPRQRQQPVSRLHVRRRGRLGKLRLVSPRGQKMAGPMPTPISQPTPIPCRKITTGTDVNGRENQPVQYSTNGIPLLPDLSKPYYGPGFRLDNFNRAGNCATCHTPLASTTPNNQNCAWSGCHTDLTVERSNGVIGR